MRPGPRTLMKSRPLGVGLCVCCLWLGSSVSPLMAQGSPQHGSSGSHGQVPLTQEPAPSAMPPEQSLGLDAPVFTKVQSGDLVRVSANRRVPVGLALEQLVAVLGWKVRFEPYTLANDLKFEHINLAFDEQDPQVVIRLLAAASGVGAEIDHWRDQNGALQTTVWVLPIPDPNSLEGRQRLRNEAARWYTNFLRAPIDSDPLRESEAATVQMKLARMLKEGGELAGAAQHFRELVDSKVNHGLHKVATLRLAECLFELQEYEEALQAVDGLIRNHALAPTTGPALLLLGDLLLATQDYESCAARLDARLIGMSQTPYYVDMILKIATAYMYLADPEQTLRHMRMLSQVQDEAEVYSFSYAQDMDRFFLWGYGALGTGRSEEAMDRLELFIARAPGDPRVGVAFVMLGEAYLASGKLLEARSAALEARQYLGSQFMDAHWKRETGKLLARTALALGQKDSAFDELEVIVRDVKDPLLTLYLVDELLGDRQFTRAISNARRLVGQTDVHGDTARFKTVEALYLQARTTGVWTGFHDEAVPMLRRILDRDMQGRAVEMVAEGYRAKGDLEAAADAIQGAIR